MCCYAINGNHTHSYFEDRGCEAGSASTVRSNRRALEHGPQLESREAVVEVLPLIWCARFRMVGCEHGRDVLQVDDRVLFVYSLGRAVLGHII